MLNDRLKKRLQSGEIVFGSEILFPSPDLVELISYSGVEFIYIDMEHSATDFETIGHMIRGVEIGGATPIVRIPEAQSGSYAPLIMRVLDLGSMGVVVPHVSTAQTAREIVDAVKYAPQGHRGMFTSGRQTGYRFAMTASEYVARANESTIIALMIEDREGLDNLEEILSVGHIDLILVGSSDLAHSLGHTGRINAPEVVEAIHGIIRSCQNSGVTCGVGSFGNFPEEVGLDFIRLGARFVNVNVLNLVVSGLRSWSSRVGAQLKDLPK